MLAYGGRGLYDTNSDNEAESKGASEDVLTGGSDLASWRSIKARNVVRTELQRDLQKNQLEQLALEFGVDLGAPDVPAVDVVHGKGKVVVLTTNEGKLGVLMQRVFKCAREHDLEVLVVRRLIDFKEKLVTRGMQRALLMIDIASEDCGAWDMVRVVRQHRRVEVRDTFIAVIVDDEDDIRRMPRDVSAMLLSSPRWAKILTAHTPSLRSLSQMLGRAAHSIEKESEIAPRKAAVKVPAGNDLVFYRTQSGLVGYVHQNQHKPNIAPPARVFMGLEGNSDSVLDFRPDFLIDSASEPNPPEAAKPSSGGSTPTKGDHHEEDSGGRGFARFKKVAIAAKLTSEFMRGSVTVRSAHGAKATAKRLKDRAAAGALARAASPPKPTLHRQGSALAPSGGIVAHQPHGSAAHGHPSSMGASFRAHTRPERGASKAEEAERAREAAREREIEVKLAMPHADISRHESLQSVLRDRERRHASSAYKDASGVTEYLAQCEAMQLEPQMAFITQVNNGGISLRHFPLGFRGGKAVAMALQRNSSVAYVDFAGCDMGADAVTALAGAVTTSGSYKSIDLTLNKSGEKGGEAICKVMRDKSVAPNIRRLLLRGNQIGDKAAKQLAQALLCLHAPSGEVHKGWCAHLWYLDLRENHISADAALAIAKSIESQRGTSTGVQHLDLSDNQVMDQGVKGLAAALLTNDVLKTLRLANNQLTNETAKYFAETLEYNLRLETLDLSRNDIKGMGGVHLARALPDIRRLTRLNMAQNPLSAKAIVDLVKGATSQPGRTLRILDLSDSWNPNSAMSAGKSLGDKLFANIIELKEFRTFVSRALEGLSPSLVLMDEEVQEAINVCSRICTHPAFTSLLRDSLVLELSSVTVGDVTKKASVEMMIVFDEVTKLEQVWAMELEHDSDAERPQAEVILNLAAPLAPTPRARGNSDPDDLQLQAGQYSLNLGNPWERCVAVRLFEAFQAKRPIGLTMALFQIKRQAFIAIPPPLTSHLIAKYGFQPQDATHLPLEHQVPKSGQAEVVLTRAAPVFSHTYTIDLSTPEGAALVTSLRSRLEWYSTSERAVEVTLEGRRIDCFADAIWIVPPRGILKVTYEVLAMSWDVSDVWGSMTLDLAVPWERVVAISLYQGVRARDMLRLQAMEESVKAAETQMRQLLLESTSDAANTPAALASPKAPGTPPVPAPPPPVARTPRASTPSGITPFSPHPPTTPSRQPDTSGPGGSGGRKGAWEARTGGGAASSISRVLDLPMRPLFSEAGLKAASSLPEWEAVCYYQGREVPIDRMVALPETGKLRLEVTHAHPRRALARTCARFVLDLHKPVQRWVAEAVWKRCYLGGGGKDLPESGRDRILKWPVYNGMRYENMHKAVGGAVNWFCPEPQSKEPGILDFFLLVEDEHFLSFSEERWDLSDPDSFKDAMFKLTGDGFLGYNRLQCTPAEVQRAQLREKAAERSNLPHLAPTPAVSAHASSAISKAATPMPAPYEYQQRLVWKLPGTGILSGQRAQLRSVVSSKLPGPVVQALLADLENRPKSSVRGKMGALEVLQEALAQKPFYATMAAEQAARVLKSGFIEDDSVGTQETVLAVEMLYKSSKEPQRFLLQLASPVEGKISGASAAGAATVQTALQTVQRTARALARNGKLLRSGAL